jgi:hypothetical protein
MRKTERKKGRKERDKKKGSRKTFPLYADYFVPLNQSITISIFIALPSSCLFCQYQYD